MTQAELENRIREAHARRISSAIAADLCGISVCKLKRIARLLGLDWPNTKAKPVTIDGITDSVNGHARRLGMSAGCLAWRLDRYGTPHPEYIRGRRPAGLERFVELRRQGLPAWEAAAKAGDTYTRLDKWAKAEFGDEYRAIVRKAKRVRRTRAQLQQQEKQA